MPDSNVYEAPSADLVDNNNITREEQEYLLSIAKRQKHLIYSFLFYVILSCASGAARGAANEELEVLFQIVGVLLFLVIVVFNIRLSWKLYGPVRRIIMIVLGIIPLINFIVILVVSSESNKILKKSGFKVGFMGAKISDIEK